MMTRLTLLATLVAASLTACGPAKDRAPLTPVAVRDTLATAEIFDAWDRSYGIIYVSQDIGGIALEGVLTTFPPGEYAMHLHSVGRCEGPDFASAGGHWNPTGHEHGLKNPRGWHLGDLPNLIGTADSVAQVQTMTVGGQLLGDSLALLDEDGASIVIHANPDDGETNPSGNSGDRRACAVIRLKQ